MRNIILITLLLICSAATAQNLIPFATGRATDTASTPGSILVPKYVRLPNYSTSDSNKVLGVGSNGMLVLRTKGAGSSADSSVFATLYRVDTAKKKIRDTIAAITLDRAAINGSAINRNISVNNAAGTIATNAASIELYGYTAASEDRWGLNSTGTGAGTYGVLNLFYNNGTNRRVQFIPSSTMAANQSVTLRPTSGTMAYTSDTANCVQVADSNVAVPGGYMTFAYWNSNKMTAGRYLGSSGSTIYFDTTYRNLPLANFNIGYGRVSTTNTNTVIGAYADSGLTTGTNNVVVGREAGAKIKSGSDCVAVGYMALAADTGNINAVAVGSGALQNFRNGASGVNTAVGYHSFNAATTATSNTALGYNTGAASTTGGGNTLMGHNVANAGTSISNNALFGFNVCSGGSFSGSNNTSMGATSGVGLTSGSSNTFVGYSAGSLVTTGSKDVIIGSFPGTGLTTASNYVVLSDGDGNVRMYIPSTGNVVIGGSSVTDAGYPLQVNGGNIYAPNTTTGANTDSLVVYASGQFKKYTTMSKLVNKGRTTLVAGTSTVTDANCTTAADITVSYQTTSGTLGYLKAVAGTGSFVITSESAAGVTQTMDISTVSYIIRY